jgi:hypothetical protein
MTFPNIMIEENIKQKICDHSGFFLDFYLTLKVEATCSSETSVYFQPSTRCYVPEDNSRIVQSPTEAVHWLVFSTRVLAVVDGMTWTRGLIVFDCAASIWSGPGLQSR